MLSMLAVATFGLFISNCNAQFGASNDTWNTTYPLCNWTDIWSGANTRMDLEGVQLERYIPDEGCPANFTQCAGQILYEWNCQAEDYCQANHYEMCANQSWNFTESGWECMDGMVNCPTYGCPPSVNYETEFTCPGGNDPDGCAYCQSCVFGKITFFIHMRKDWNNIS